MKTLLLILLFPLGLVAVLITGLVFWLCDEGEEPNYNLHAWKSVNK